MLAGCATATDPDPPAETGDVGDSGETGAPLEAQPSARTAPFRLHEEVIGSQDHPTVALGAGGSWLAAWEQADGVSARVWDLDGTALGEEVAVSEHGISTHPQVATADGGWLVGWRDAIGERILLRPHDLLAVPTGEAVEVSHDTGARIASEYVDVAMTSGGEVIVAWHESVLAEAATFWRRYGPDLVPVGPQHRVDALDARATGGPVSVGVDDHGVLVGWSEAGASTSAVHVRRYSLDGTPAGAVIVVGTGSEGTSRPDLATGPDGSFAVAWREQDQERVGHGAWVRVYAGDEPTTEPLPMPVFALANRPALAAEGDTFLVAWEAADAGETGIWAQLGRFPDGRWEGEALLVNEVVTWESVDQDGDLRGAYGRVLELTR